jgi:hypothetical protein
MNLTPCNTIGDINYPVFYHQRTDVRRMISRYTCNDYFLKEQITGWSLQLKLCMHTERWKLNLYTFVTRNSCFKLLIQETKAIQNNTFHSMLKNIIERTLETEANGSTAWPVLQMRTKHDGC